MAGVVGIEPTHSGVKGRCLSAWRHPPIKGARISLNTRAPFIDPTRIALELCASQSRFYGPLDIFYKQASGWIRTSVHQRHDTAVLCQLSYACIYSHRLLLSPRRFPPCRSQGLTLRSDCDRRSAVTCIFAAHSQPLPCSKPEIIPGWSHIGESNPHQLLGRQLCYHYTNAA